MDYIYSIILIIGALSLFIYGMQLLSEGIQRAAGSQIRKGLRFITNRSILGVSTGFLLTALIQSSSATTVLTVGLVNAGIINLTQSVGLIMGANIGTTLTSWIIAWSEYQVHLTNISLILFAVSIPMILRNKHSLKYWGEFLIGLGIMLLSLDILSNIVSSTPNNEMLFAKLATLSNAGLSSRFLFVFIGVAITLFLQSSSAAMALIIVVCSRGYISLDIGMSLVLGLNIGTTFTAEVAALLGNLEARRAARVHTFFNIIGVAYFILLLPLFKDFTTYILASVFNLTIEKDSTLAISNGLAIFHSTFNIVNTIILLPLSHYLIRLAKLTVMYKKSEPGLHKSLVTKTNIKTPEFSVLEINKDLYKYYEIVCRMLGFTKELFLSFNPREQNSIVERLEKYKSISEKINDEIYDFTSDTLNREVSTKTNNRLRSVFTINDNIKKISKHYFEITQDLLSMRNEKIWISPVQRHRILDYIDTLHKYNEVVKQHLNEDTSVSSDYMENNLNQHLISLTNDELNEEESSDEVSNVKGTLIYDNIVDRLEDIRKLSEKIIKKTKKL